MNKASYFLLSQNKPVLEASRLVVYSILSSHPSEDLKELGKKLIAKILYYIL